jgi:hypothetical protein
MGEPRSEGSEETYVAPVVEQVCCIPAHPEAGNPGGTRPRDISSKTEIHKANIFPLFQALIEPLTPEFDPVQMTFVNYTAFRFKEGYKETPRIINMTSTTGVPAAMGKSVMNMMGVPIRPCFKL